MNDVWPKIVKEIETYQQASLFQKKQKSLFEKIMCFFRKP